MKLDVLNSDLIELIIKIRTDDIEYSILMLEEKMNVIKIFTNGLDIELLKTDEDDVIDNHNDRYAISFSYIVYSCCPYYLYDTIVDGNCIFVYSVEIDDEIITILSPIYNNPTMCMLCAFTNKYIEYYNNVNNVAGFSILPKTSYERYNIPNTNLGVSYIELALEF